VTEALPEFLIRCIAYNSDGFSADGLHPLCGLAQFLLTTAPVHHKPHAFLIVTQ
jgi:hypothetical protein